MESGGEESKVKNSQRMEVILMMEMMIMCKFDYRRFVVSLCKLSVETEAVGSRLLGAGKGIVTRVLSRCASYQVICSRVL